MLPKRNIFKTMSSPRTPMNNHSLTLSLLFAFAFLLPANVQAQINSPNEALAASPNCSGQGPAEILILDPDGHVTAAILVVAEETTAPVTPAAPIPVTTVSSVTSVSPVAVTPAASVAAVVPVSVPQFEIQAPVYSTPVETFYPTFQPQAPVCTSGG